MIKLKEIFTILPFFFFFLPHSTINANFFPTRLSPLNIYKGPFDASKQKNKTNIWVTDNFLSWYLVDSIKHKQNSEIYYDFTSSLMKLWAKLTNSHMLTKLCK